MMQLAMLMPHEDHIGCIYIRLSFIIEILQIKSSHFILRAGKDRLVSSNLALALYTRIRPGLSLIPCDILRGIILAWNFRAGFEEMGTSFSWIQTFNMGWIGLIRWIMNISIVALYYLHYIFTTFFSPLQLGLIILYVTKLILQNIDKVGYSCRVQRSHTLNVLRLKMWPPVCKWKKFWRWCTNLNVPEKCSRRKLRESDFVHWQPSNHQFVDDFVHSKQRGQMQRWASSSLYGRHFFTVCFTIIHTSNVRRFKIFNISKSWLACANAGFFSFFFLLFQTSNILKFPTFR